MVKFSAGGDRRPYKKSSGKSVRTGQNERVSMADLRNLNQHPYPFKQKIGESIALLMQNRHRSKEQLATALGVTAWAVTQWIEGWTQPSQERWVELANYLDGDLNWLMCRDLVGLSDEELRVMRRTLPGKPALVRGMTVYIEPSV